MKKMILLSTVTAIALFAGHVNISTMPDNPQRVYPSNNSVVLSYNNSIKEVKHSVVNISTTKTVNQNNQLNQMLNNPLLKDFFGRSFPENSPQQRKAHSLGSGVIISKDGYIVTNNHVVEDADEIIVTLLGETKEYKAKVIGLDSKTDLAVIKIEGDSFKAVKFGNSDNSQEGDVVFAIGNPFGVGGSVTQGIISALNKTSIGLNQYENFIQTDASINPGNSGGALVDSRGALIGINSAILSRSGGNNGIGFAIPSQMVKNIATALIEKGKIERGYIGVSISNLTNDLKEVYKHKNGAFILNVEKSSPASKAGIQRGDLIIEIDNVVIKSANDLKNSIGNKRPGTTVEVKYERNSKIKSTKIVLANMDKSLSQATTTTSIQGLKLEELSSNIRQKYQIPPHIKGILITGVKSGSTAYKLGFMPGDIIVQVDQTTIESFKDFKKALENKKKKILYINRNGYHMAIVIK
ncbi:Do family serine endopeptidase [Sulfurospirillum arcachonense]|uniref:Do family serine endopeptidase n=1 Tax=Sulfurospirillum arcachonense TaxID=57666 RepID=UPI000468B383|nr:Do family serine endopeptidase [Sulfurospirillum arcachonense]